MTGILAVILGCHSGMKKKIASGYHVIRHIDRIGYLWTIGNELDKFKKYGWIFIVLK